MQTEDFEHLYALEQEFWWFVGMRDITKVILTPYCSPDANRLVLDAGCGTGGMMSWLRNYAGRGSIAGIDLNSTALSFSRQQGHSLLTQASITEIPFSDAIFDLVTSFDVLVQLPGKDSDVSAINEMMRVLKPGGILFVRVAAYEWMKSDHDRSLATQHRYTLPELKEKLNRAGFEILRSTYANTLLLPLAMFRRLALKPLGLAKGSDVKPLPSGLRWANAPMSAALRAEAGWIKKAGRKLPFGLSAICVARKPQRSS